MLRQIFGLRLYITLFEKVVQHLDSRLNDFATVDFSFLFTGGNAVATFLFRQIKAAVGFFYELERLIAIRRDDGMYAEADRQQFADGRFLMRDLFLEDQHAATFGHGPR